MRYAVLSLVCFLLALVPLGTLLWRAEKLAAIGLTGNLYYVALVPLGLAAAAFLFGALRSYAHYRGRQFGGVLELGGPVVIFLLVIVLGFLLPRPASNFALTIYLHGRNGTQDLVLRGAGYVLLDTGGARRKAQVGNEGEAFFPEIPANLRGQEVSVALDADGYEMAIPNEKIRLNGSSAYVQVRKKPGFVAGRVKDEAGRPLPGVRIALGGLTTTTDDAGHFNILVPGESFQANLILNAVAPSYAPWSGEVVPNSNEITITLHRQR